MILIAGLGNPTDKYRGTRHNVGFDAIDRIAEDNDILVETYRHKALCGKGIIGGQKVLIMKPQTFMNNSGECLREVLDYYKEDVDNVLVIYDDICLDVGRLRLRPKGSAGGHNGIKSIIAHLGTEEFPRIRVGVGDKPKNYDLADWVLGHFPKEQLDDVRAGIDKAVKAVPVVLDRGIEEGMNEFNAK